MLLIPMTITLLTSVAFANFTDNTAGDSHFTAISALEEMGIINGYEDNTFRSDEKISRAEALKMITLASGLFEEEDMDRDAIVEEGEERPFTDTPLSAWYTPYLQAAKDEGIIKGYEDGTFEPTSTINLAESIKILLESYKIDLTEVNYEYLVVDTPEDSWFADYAAYLLKPGILNISSTNEIYADQEMTRGYLAEIIYRLEQNKKGSEFGKATFYGKALQGNGTASGETFDYNLLTAAHKYLPFGTIVEVTNLSNGEKVQVKINDRGPYGYGRVIDLSRSAFEKISSLGAGVINIEYKVTYSP